MKKYIRVLFFLFVTTVSIQSVYAESVGVIDEKKIEKIKQKIEKANYCSTNQDCLVEYFQCPFGSYSYINKSQQERIKQLVDVKTNCVYEALFPNFFQKNPVCIQNKCVASTLENVLGVASCDELRTELGRSLRLWSEECIKQGINKNCYNSADYYQELKDMVAKHKESCLK